MILVDSSVWIEHLQVEEDRLDGVSGPGGANAMQKIYIKSLSVLIFLGILVTGCVVIPLPGGEAFSDKEIDFIEVGSTSRNEIRSRLGQPLTHIYVDGPIELYRDFNATVVIVSLTAN